MPYTFEVLEESVLGNDRSVIVRVTADGSLLGDNSNVDLSEDFKLDELSVYYTNGHINGSIGIDAENGRMSLYNVQGTEISGTGAIEFTVWALGTRH